MIIAKIVQDGQIITLKDVASTFQYSANLQIQFIKDPKYNEYQLIGFYRNFANKEYLLDIDKDGIFTLGKDIFIKKGIVEFSFSLIKNDEEVHLGIIKLEIKYTFGSGDAILPEEQDTWIQVVSRVVEDQVSRIWDKDYKPQLEQNLNIIEAKTEEIKTAAMGVKQDALESSTNAKSSLDSANLAQSSANTALEAEEKALEHMSNAEKFKNDASSYADQANLAKTEAQKSATNASNSASSALNSANKAKEHLDNVTDKVNAFNEDYTNKVNNFNSNAENANNTLDAKIEKANTDIDKKVLDANTSLDTKIADANGVMDAKVTEATQQANIATDKAKELSEVVDKVNYLEDALDTKLTQPYVSSPVIENGTISDSDEGLLRNLKIYGKCTQKIETDIVPTPSRPVPITSKKIIADGEVVELRSLKESVNLFDLGLLSKTELIPKTGAYRKIDIPLQLKPSTKYTFSYDPWEVPASSWVVLNIGAEDNKGLAGVFNFENKTTEPQSKDKKSTVFTTSSTGYVYFNYYASGGDKGYIDLWFTKLLNNIMLVEGTTVPTSYVPPTVRDYKIVDHVNKKAWIERNVYANDISTLVKQTVTVSDNVTYFLATPKPISVASNDEYCTKLNLNNYYLLNKNEFGLSSNLLRICVPNNITTWDEVREYLGDVIFQYKLKTPIIEEIPYLENDQSEFGVSSQDNTSPSPTIKSEVETVTELNIKSCAKNLFDVSKANRFINGVLTSANNTGNKEYAGVDITEIFNYAYENNQKITVSFDLRVDKQGDVQIYSLGRRHLQGTKIVQADTEYKRFSATFSLYISPEIDVNGEECVLSFYGTYGTGVIPYIKNLQIEVGDTATEYEPYQETGFSYELEKPLVKCGDIADVIDLNNLERINNNYFGLLDLVNQNISYGSLVGNHQSCYWRANTMPKPKLLKENGDINNILCSRFVSNLTCYGRDIGETISIYKDSSADFIAVFNINRFRNVNEFKQFFVDTPTMVAYPLAEPTVEPLEPELVEKLKTLMSFYPVTHIISNVPISFDRKLNLENWHKVVSGQVEDAKDVIYNLTVQQNNLEVMQLESSLETQYNMDLLKLGGM